MKLMCIICAEIFTSDCNARITSCGHLYHNICIAKWLEENSTCPHCRRTVNWQTNNVYFDGEDESGDDSKTVRLANSGEKVKEEFQVMITEVQQFITKEEDEKEKLKSTVAECEYKIRDLQIIISQTQEKLDLYERIDKLLKSKDDRVTRTLQSAPPSKLRSLAISLYQQGRQKRKWYYTKIKKLSENSSKLKKKINNLRVENDELKYKYIYNNLLPKNYSSPRSKKIIRAALAKTNKLKHLELTEFKEKKPKEAEESQPSCSFTNNSVWSFYKNE